MRKGLFYILGLDKKTFSSNFILIATVLAMVAITVTPLLYNAKILMRLWIVLLVLTFGYILKTNISIKKFAILGAIFILFCIIYKILGISSAEMGYCVSSPILFFAPIIALVIIERCESQSQVRFIFHFISLVIAINVLDSIRLTYTLRLEDVVYQRLAETIAEENGATNLNLGGSMFVNMVVFYTDVMFFTLMKSKKLLEKIIFLLYFVIGVYFIVMCSLKASAVLLLLVSVILMYLAKKGERKFNRMIVLSFIVVGAFFLFRDEILNFLISTIDSTRVSSRISAFLTTSEVSDSSTFMARQNLWMVSLQSWLGNATSFVFGIGDHAWNEFSSTEASGIGNHSDLFDVLGRYGILGGLLLYSSITILHNYLRKKYGLSYKYEILSFFILIILMGLTKKFFVGQPAIVIVILFPLSLKYCYNEKKELF